MTQWPKANERISGQWTDLSLALSRAHTVRFFKSPLGLYLSDCTNMMIMSHYGISVVINVRLYDSQDELKRVHARKLVRSFTLSTHTRPVTANCIARGTEMLAIMKSIWTAAIPAYLECMQLYTPTWKQRRNQCLYRNGIISDEFRERSTGAPEFMADRIIL